MLNRYCVSKRHTRKSALLYTSLLGGRFANLAAALAKGQSAWEHCFGEGFLILFGLKKNEEVYGEAIGFRAFYAQDSFYFWKTKRCKRQPVASRASATGSAIWLAL